MNSTSKVEARVAVDGSTQRKRSRKKVKVNGRRKKHSIYIINVHDLNIKYMHSISKGLQVKNLTSKAVDGSTQGKRSRAKVKVKGQGKKHSININVHDLRI